MAAMSSNARTSVGQVLARFDRADGEDIARRAREPVARARVTRRHIGDSVVDHVDAVARDAEDVGDLAPDELGDGVDMCAPAQRAADQCRVLHRVRVAVLRVVHRREIVHGHELGRALGRRYDEVRAVHDVDGAGPVLDRRPVDPLPELSGRAGRYRAVRHGDAGWNRRLELVEIDARVRERDDVEPGAGEARQHLVDERADSRPRLEEWCCFECDAHGRRETTARSR